MIGASTWPEAAVWIAVIASLAVITTTTIWQLGRYLTEHVRQESETGRAAKLAANSRRSQ